MTLNELAIRRMRRPITPFHVQREAQKWRRLFNTDYIKVTFDNGWWSLTIPYYGGPTFLRLAGWSLLNEPFEDYGFPE